MSGGTSGWAASLRRDRTGAIATAGEGGSHGQRAALAVLLEVVDGSGGDCGGIVDKRRVLGAVGSSSARRVANQTKPITLSSLYDISMTPSRSRRRNGSISATSSRLCPAEWRREARRRAVEVPVLEVGRSERDGGIIGGHSTRIAVPTVKIGGN